MLKRNNIDSFQQKDFREQVVGDILWEAIEYISTHFMPEDVFEEEDLNTWAEEHGYVKEEE
jgi:hypothetical protein